MLIEFKFSNFLSYKEMTSFSMVAGKERTNSKTLASIPKFRLKLLPLAAIYGANASGKSNLIKALGFLKTLVTTQRVKGKIPLRHFYYSEALLSKIICSLTLASTFTVNPGPRKLKVINKPLLIK